MVVAVIADIVGSRALGDRSAAQRSIDDALRRIVVDGPDPVQPMRPVVGDELEGIYRRLEDALVATMLLRLALPDAIDCRFGIGLGDVITVAADAGDLSDGPAWWAAREAIEHVSALERRRVPSARTWVVADQDAQGVVIANATALLRDQIIGAMSTRTRRLTYGRCIGRTQRELAEEEGITQSAVSQALAAAGAPALIESLGVMRG